MKYEIRLYRTATEQFFTEAETPHEALKQAILLHPDFTADGVSEIVEEDGEDVGGEYFERICNCESCGKPILTGDRYFLWSDEEGVSTCADCGGADANHKPSIA